MVATEQRDPLTLYGMDYDSRLLLGTARYESPHQLSDAVTAAEYSARNRPHHPAQHRRLPLCQGSDQHGTDGARDIRDQPHQA